jgi:hypothetical protein
LIDLTSTNFIDKAKDLLATWADVKDVRQDAQRITVVGGGGGLDDHQKAISMVSRVSNTLYLFDRQKDDFFDGVLKDLHGFTTFTREDMQNALRKVSQRLPKP